MREVRLLDGERLVHEVLLLGRQQRDLGADRVVDAVVHARHGGEDGGAQRLQVEQHALRWPPVEADGGAGADVADLHDELEHVGERQVGQMDVRLVEVQPA